MRRLLLVCLLLTACGTSTATDRPVVVATTTQLGDFVRAVAGDRVAVHQILEPNTDPHEYEPRPRDVRTAQGAKLVFASGNGLDDWIGDVASKAVTIAPEHLERRIDDDPHWWHDPRNAQAAVLTIRDALAKAFPDDTAGFDARAERYLAALRALDAGIAKCMSAVPPAQRKLVTSHDAFGYFTARYGITVVGAIIPSLSTRAQPSAGQIAQLADQVRREHVRAIFPESSLNPKLAQALARETGARADYELYGDTLGPEGSTGATYLTMEAANADAMVRGFTGGARGCAPRG